MESKSTLISLAIGEIVVSVLTALAYLGLNKYHWTVISGLALGFVVAMLYYIFIDISTTRVINEIKEIRGNKEMSEEEIEKFVKENEKKLQLKLQINMYIRFGVIIAAFFIAFLTKKFAIIATLVPILAVSPLLMLFEYMKKGQNK